MLTEFPQGRNTKESPCCMVAVYAKVGFSEELLQEAVLI